MKKTILALGFVLLSVSALASEKKMECFSTPDEPVYRIVANAQGDFEFRATFPGLRPVTPLYSGDVTVEILPELEKRAEFIKSMGNVVSAVFPAAQCIRKKNAKGNYYVNCFHKKTEVLGGQKVHGMTFYMHSRFIESYSAGEERDKETLVGIEFALPSTIGIHWTPFPKTFEYDQCHFTPDFWN